MARLLTSLRRFLGYGLSHANSTTPSAAARYGRSIDTDFSIFREGDRVIVNGRSVMLTKPLERGRRTDTRKGVLDHNNIIGQRVRSRIQAYKGPDYRITYPTLEEYVTLTPRLVTPVYPADANLIVSLLDIHVPTPSASDSNGTQPPLEILESGTGHGSLTLHLARAIHAANTPAPAIPKTSQSQILQKQTADEKPSSAKADPSSQETADQTQVAWDAWRAQRQAVIHTVDISPKFSEHAEQIVRGFRRGLYAGNVDFYVSSVEDWVAEQTHRRERGGMLTKARTEPFLSHVILDMPSAQLRIPRVAPLMRHDATLAVFMPNITQIGDCVELIRKQKLPFVMDRVVELGTGISSGRLWDVRLATRRASSKAVEEKGTEEADLDASETASEDSVATEEKEVEIEEKGGDVLVCRPKVGARVVGGGFVGIWKRKSFA